MVSIVYKVGVSLLLLGLIVEGTDFETFRAFTSTGWNPPDGAVAAGRDKVIAAVNGRITIFDKETMNSIDSTSLSAFIRQESGSPFDPRIIWDPFNDRFVGAVTSGFNGATSSVIIFVSTTSSPETLDPIDWYEYRFEKEITSMWADYPTLGLDHHNVYFSVNMFNDAGSSNTFFPYWIVNKNDLYNGVDEDNLNFVLNEFPNRWYTVYPAVNYNQNVGSTQYMVNLAAFNRLRLIELRNVDSQNLDDITLHEFQVTVPAFSSFIAAEQKDTDRTVVTNDTRIQTAFMIGNILYVAHTSGNIANGLITTARIYEIDVISRQVVRTHFIDDGASGIHNFYPAAVADKFGNMGFVHCTSSGNMFPSMSAGYHNVTTGEYSRDIVVDGTKAHFSSRYGDYSDMSLDPNDFQTFWGLAEVSSGTSSWEIYIVKFCPSCGLDIQDSCVGVNCNDNGICVDGVCDCNHGFVLDDCSECLENYYGPDCLECNFCNNGECLDGINGSGECECETGWNGLICTECEDGYYGPTCEQCPFCNNGECSDGLQGNGECICDDGWVGELCDVPNDSCQNGFEYIIDDVSTCICQCGWQGELCSECSEGYFTNNCVPCSICQNGVCSESECICNEGWSGTLCDTQLSLCGAPSGYCCTDEQCPGSYCKNYKPPHPNGFWTCQ